MGETTMLNDFVPLKPKEVCGFFFNCKLCYVNNDYGKNSK